MGNNELVRHYHRKDLEMTDKTLERYELLMECKQWENKKGEAIDLEETDDKHFNRIINYAITKGYIDKNDKQELKRWRKSLDGSC